MQQMKKALPNFQKLFFKVQIRNFWGTKKYMYHYALNSVKLLSVEASQAYTLNRFGGEMPLPDPLTSPHSTNSSPLDITNNNRSQHSSSLENTFSRFLKVQKRDFLRFLK